MATIRYAIPGIGGSLGMCAVCGESFAFEVITGKSVGSLKLGGVARELPVHDKCAEKVVALQGTWEEIRDKFPEGPIKEAFEEEFKESGIRASSSTQGRK